MHRLAFDGHFIAIFNPKYRRYLHGHKHPELADEPKIDLWLRMASAFLIPFAIGQHLVVYDI